MIKLVVIAAALAAAAPILAQPKPEPVFSSDLIVNGVTTSADGRMFLPVQPQQPRAGPQVVEVKDGKPVPFPDARWNGWQPGMDGADRFVGVNSIRVGPDGALWVVDRGGPGIGKPLAPHGVKLVRIDLATNRVARVYDLGSVTRPWSFVDDIRFNGGHAYLTDAGHPGLIVLDLASGKGRRLLDGHPSTIAQTPLRAEGKPGGNLAEEDRINAAMLCNLLDALNAVGAPLERVVLYQGAKVYGVHLGPVPSPFYEDANPRPIGPNFYFSQEDELRRRADAGGSDWTILRPDVVLGDAAGNAMNIATVIGAYAALTKADGAAFRFPGSAHVYDHCLAQFTDAHALARASLWAATADAARGQAFNYVHAPFRWRRVWEKIAGHFGLETGEPIPFSLAGHMPALEPVWRRIAGDLGQPDYARAIGWGFGDFVFGSAFDVLSDTTKIRTAGFGETLDPADALIAAIERQIGARILPRP